MTYGDHIHEAKDEDDDARANHNAPERKSQGLLTCSGLVQIAEHVDAQDDHREPEGDEAVDRTE